MTDLPLDLLRRVAQERLAREGASPLFVTISGAHLYGFASPDSDFDVRGCHLLPLSRVVAMEPARETIEYSGIQEDREIDLVSHDAAKFFRLMLRKNGYVMEQFFSPLVVLGGDELAELRDIARGCLTRHLHHHYKGFAENELEILGRQAEKKAKTMLYIYRVLLTGIHVLQSGEVEANLLRLLELHPQGEAVHDLVRRKVMELSTIPNKDAEAHGAAFGRLQGELDRAFEKSHLPEVPARAADLDALLVSLRLSADRR